MVIADKFRDLGIRTNADTPDDSARARSFGAEGIGLFRTEHMFYGIGSEKPLFFLRKMILSSALEERKKALSELFPFVKKDIKDTLKEMEGLPVTIRLLDPPLHEFVPQNEDKQKELADSLGINVADIKKRGEKLHETNPMMGHRGVRLGVSYPEITEMQVKAILEAAAELVKDGIKCLPEIMVPVTCDVSELKDQRKLVDAVAKEVRKKYDLKKLDFLYGTMIEIPRAAILAGKMAEEAQFFSFGTNDLTQMTFGFSRDDIGGFMQDYLDKKVLNNDPFQILDVSGVGFLVELAVKEGRKTNPKLKIGICGEHGGEPKSVEFCCKIGLNYVSCSPFRVPVAILAAAQSAIKAERAKNKKK
jgi:pyruvate,orthophosphate dikinase